MTEVNTALAYGHFRKVGQLIPKFQLRRKLAHEIMDDTIGVNTVDSVTPMRSKCTTAIVPCKLLKVKKHEGSYDKKAKLKESNKNIKNIDTATLKLAANRLEVFLNVPWASFCAMDVSSNIKVRL